jgi:hypothetical protein
MPSDGKSSHCLWQGELKIKKKKKIHSPLVIISVNEGLFFI